MFADLKKSLFTDVEQGPTTRLLVLNDHFLLNGYQTKNHSKKVHVSVQLRKLVLLLKISAAFRSTCHTFSFRDHGFCDDVTLPFVLNALRRRGGGCVQYHEVPRLVVGDTDEERRRREPNDLLAQRR